MVAKAQLVTLIPTKNMSRAVKFYTKILGGKVQYRPRGEMKNFWASLKVGDAEVWLIAPQKWEKRTLAYNTFVVKNIKAYVTALQAKGVKFEKAEKMGPDTKLEGSIAWEPMGASAFFKDSEGNLLGAWQNIPPR
jgi:predicted enzyme related to lactoylglutathione lyase